MGGGPRIANQLRSSRTAFSLVGLVSGWGASLLLPNSGIPPAIPVLLGSESRPFRGPEGTGVPHVPITAACSCLPCLRLWSAGPSTHCTQGQEELDLSCAACPASDPQTSLRSRGGLAWSPDYRGGQAREDGSACWCLAGPLV